ncbi:MAG: hypothetical protein ACWGQW_03460, partial [bacterium]
MKLDEIISLDIETAPTTPTDSPYALEPWRLPQGKAEITAVTCYDGNDCISIDHKKDDMAVCIPVMLEQLKGQHVVAHNAMFDVAWLYAQTQDYDLINNIDWLDSQLLSKWYSNGQVAEDKRMSHSLVNACQRHLA